MNRSLLFALPFLVVACTAAPTVSTPAQRATATRAITLAETTCNALIATKGIRAEDAPKVAAAIAELRAMVAASETIPTDLLDVATRAGGLYLQWVVAK